MKGIARISGRRWVRQSGIPTVVDRLVQHATPPVLIRIRHDGKRKIEANKYRHMVGTPFRATTDGSPLQRDSLFRSYLAGSGTVTNSGVGRGLFRAIRHVVEGEYLEAGVETLAAVAAPALMSYASTASLVLDVVDGAYELAGPAMEEGDIRRFRERDVA